jgi:site-specific DNA-methyltransferase (adenine-specific)
MTKFQRNCAQVGDALALTQSLPDNCTSCAFFDPQHRSILDRQQYGNEGRGRQKARIALPAMTDDYIDDVIRQIARTLIPFGYLMQWTDTYRLGEGYHQRTADVLKLVDIIHWDSGKLGNGHRVRKCGGYLLVLQKPKISRTGKWKVIAKNWTDHGIREHWFEKVDRKIHPHVKPVGLITRLISAVTNSNDLLIDPAAGSFAVMHAAHGLGREFIGCDLAYQRPSHPVLALKSRIVSPPCLPAIATVEVTP